MIHAVVLVRVTTHPSDCVSNSVHSNQFLYLMRITVHVRTLSGWTPGQLRARTYTPFVLRWKNGQPSVQENIHSELVSDAAKIPAKGAQLWRQWRESSERGIHRELRADADRQLSGQSVVVACYEARLDRHQFSHRESRDPSRTGTKLFSRLVLMSSMIVVALSSEGSGYPEGGAWGYLYMYIQSSTWH